MAIRLRYGSNHAGFVFYLPLAASYVRLLSPLATFHSAVNDAVNKHLWDLVAKDCNDHAIPRPARFIDGAMEEIT